MTTRTTTQPPTGRLPMRGLPAQPGGPAAASGARPRAGVDWITPPRPGPRRRHPAVLPVVPRRRAQHLLQRARPARRRAAAADQPALIYDSPGHRHAADATPTPSCSSCVARFAGALRALGVEQGDRVVIYMPMVPEAVVAMLACARIGAVHSVVFGGFAPAELAARIDDAQPKVVVTASCGIEPTRVVEYKPLLDAALDAGDAQARARSSSCSGRRCRAELGERDVDWDDARCGRTPSSPADCVAGRGDRPALHPLHLRHDRAAQGHRPRQRRPRRRAALVDGRTSTTSSRATCSGPPATSAGSSATPTSSTRRCSPARRRCSTRASRSARRTPARSGGSSREHRVNALFTAPTAFRAIKKEDPTGELLADARPLVAAHAVPRRGAARPRHLPLGRPSGSASRSSTTGGRPRPAGRSRPTCAGLEPMPIKPGSPTVPVPGLRRRGSSTPDGEPVAPGAEGAICIRLPLPPGHAADAVAATTSATSRLPLGVRRLLPHRRRRLPSTRTATSSSWAAPTTSSTSPGTGSRPGRWRRCSPRTPRSPSAP